MNVYTFSFSEFMSIYNGNEINGLNEYINYSRLPLITRFESAEETIEYLKLQKNNAYINDVIERNAN